MNGFHVSALAAALVAMASASARAQSGDPIDIIPRTPSVEAPRENDSPPEPAGAETGPSDFEIDLLVPVDPDSFGLYAQDEGGLGFEVWRGTDRTLAEKLLARLPDGISSPVMRDLIRRLLLSEAHPPQGDATLSFVAIRAERLAALGLLDEQGVRAFVNAAPGGHSDDALERFLLDTMLLAAEDVPACAMVRQGVEALDSAYRQRVLIYCDAVTDNDAAAALGQTLLQEPGFAEDRSFDVLLGLMLDGGEGPLDRLPNPSALHLAMLRELGMGVPADAVQAASPGLVEAIAFTADTALPVRLEAAERAEALGLLAAERLARLYTSVDFTPDELASPSDAIADVAGPIARALMYKVALWHAVPVARAEALRAYWGLAESTRGWRGFATATRVSAGLVLGLTPAAELTWFAGDAVRALFAADHVGAAQGWLALAAAESVTDPEAAAVLATVRPLADIALGNPDHVWTGEAIEAWLRSHGESTEIETRNRRRTMHTLVEALGESLPGPAWVSLLDGPLAEWANAPTATLWRALESAAAAGRVGATILLAQLALNNGDIESSGMLPLGMAVSALHRIGLEAEARDLALEAALAHRN